MWSPLKSVEDTYTRQSDRSHFVYSFVFHDKVTKIRVDVTRRPRSSTKITLWQPPLLVPACLWLVTSRWLWTFCLWIFTSQESLNHFVRCTQSQIILKHISKFIREVSVLVAPHPPFLWRVQTARTDMTILYLGLFVAIGGWTAKYRLTWARWDL